MFTCSTLLLFPYPVPADIHRSVQHVTLGHVPVNVLPRLFLWFSQVKQFECRHIHPPQEVQCVHMYSVAWDVLVICTNHYLTETGGELGGRGELGGGCGPDVWGALCGELCGGTVCGSCVSFISCISDWVHSRTHGSVQYVILWHVSVNVLPSLFLWFSQAKHFECHAIPPPQEVQCVHMYGVART